ncbi:MAG TPA: hypothetical protein VG013_24310 [Gemmataceae bacterium]|jgi:hypothetical protein|nr:hypothetical protein [Gemmataceae bacterium]
MWHVDSPQLQDELQRSVLDRTGRRVRNLAIELSPERVILRGQAATYYVKQLAQHGVRDLLPDVSLENTIVVDMPSPPLAAMAFA